MIIVVFGANGKVGRKIVGKLLADGHTVRAFIHHHSGLTPHKKLKLIKGDIHLLNDVERAINGSDAVISALGSWGTKTKDIVASGTANIIPAMEKHGVKRIVTLTGAGAQDIFDQPGLIDKISRPLLFLVAGKILRDGERHIALLRASQLDWTVVRSPAMLENGKSRYKLSNKAPFPWETIVRRDVALAMAGLATSNSKYRSAPFIKK